MTHFPNQESSLFFEDGFDEKPFSLAEKSGMTHDERAGAARSAGLHLSCINRTGVDEG
jgi:hypothetical protein